MFCTKCGEKINDKKRFCASCGNLISTNSTQQESKDSVHSTLPTKKNKNHTGFIIRLLVGVSILIFIISLSTDDQSIEINNKALESYSSGDSDLAITQLQQASQSAVTDDNKINSLKNLAYIYSTEGKEYLALDAFKDAFLLASADSFDYFLISGEIALLEGNPTSAQYNYLKAYDLDPENFQINNTLNLFYLDIDGIDHEYIDYSKALFYAKRANDFSGEAKVEVVTKQNLGLAYFFNEEYGKTIEILLPYGSTDPYSAYFLGMSYLAKENDVNAKFFLQKALDGGVEMPEEIINYLSY